MILVDSSVWIDYFRGASTVQAEKLDKLLGGEKVAIEAARNGSLVFAGIGNYMITM